VTLALVVADPPERFHPLRETTSHLVAALRSRGVDVHLCLPHGIEVRGSRVVALARRVQALTGPPFQYTLGDPGTLGLARFALVFLRHDPPADERFRAPLLLLRLVAGQVRCINEPHALLEWSEKTLPLLWPELIPETWIVSDATQGLAAVRELGHAVAKPLNRAGGSGVFLLRDGDPNVPVILEECLRGEPRLVIQKFLPGIERGDARILVLGGRILGSFLRLPAASSHRANLHRGGRAARWEVPDADRRRLSPLLERLEALGVAFAGLDWIDGHLTEVNITSPMGLHELQDLGFHSPDGRTAAETVIDHCLREAARG
jgi:glutathione synthase